MLRSDFKWRRDVRVRHSFITPLILGAALWLSFPTIGAFQDIGSLVSGTDAGQPRWNAFVETSAAGSVHTAQMLFSDDDLTTSSINGGGLNTSEMGKVVVTPAKSYGNPVPDEDRINRSGKRGRLVKVAPVAPPKDFNAGSVVDRSSLLLDQRTSENFNMAFVKPEILGRELTIATAFHIPRKETPVLGVSRMLAGLINNPRPDVLATAYAPPEPDYASTSPFASILNEEGNEENGRFIPPSAEGDHDWLSEPLPPSVFSASEQRCLTAGVYFEARGEPVAGQAAVAQVILNRVRNPSYPNTVCGVVYQNKSWRNRCQFSFACDGIRDRIASPAYWETAEEVAQAVTAGIIWFEEVGSSTHYHATYVKPRWARTMKRMKKIGQHIFYRTYGGGWT